jgi:hypothetical protein
MNTAKDDRHGEHVRGKAAPGTSDVPDGYEDREGDEKSRRERLVQGKLLEKERSKSSE